MTQSTDDEMTKEQSNLKSVLADTTIEFLQSVKIETKPIRESNACLLVEGSLGLQAGVMIVEAEVPAFGRDSIAGVIVKRCHFLPQLVSRVAFRKLLVSQLHLLLYKLFHFRCIHILQPEKKITITSKMPPPQYKD